MPKVKCEYCSTLISVSKRDLETGNYPKACPKCRKKAAKKGINESITRINEENEFSDDQLEIKKAKRKW